MVEVWFYYGKLSRRGCWGHMPYTPLSRRNVMDSIVWLQINNSGVYSVKSKYHLARQIMRNGDVIESSLGLTCQHVWSRLWKLHIPNKIKETRWGACQDILPTCVNLASRRIITDNTSECCKRALETGIHVLWECGVAQDVWARSQIKLQKCTWGQADILLLFESLFNRLS